MNDKKPRRNPFTDCWVHARLSKSVAHCPYPLNPYRGAWINEYNRTKQVDFVGKK